MYYYSMDYANIAMHSVEGVEVDCPDCGEEAIVNDDGLYCPNCDK